MLRSRRIGAMRDVELYRALLGLTAPWTVTGVDVDLKGQRVVVRVEAGPGPYPCPECGTPTGLGMAYLKQGKKNEAATELKTALDPAPNMAQRDEVRRILGELGR
jgi:hypothetical protein